MPFDNMTLSILIIIIFIVVGLLYLGFLSSLRGDKILSEWMKCQLYVNDLLDQRLDILEESRIFYTFHNEGNDPSNVEKKGQNNDRRDD